MSITKTPWQADDSESTAISAEINGVKFWIADFALYPGLEDESGADNRDRAVACVNACTGIDTEVLETLADNDKTLTHLILKVVKQRDELLEALIELNSVSARGFLYDDPARVKARRVIASVKGQL